MDDDSHAARLDGECFACIFVAADFVCLVWSGIEVGIKAGISMALHGCVIECL